VDKMSKQKVASWVLRGIGALLVALAIVHLVATPHIPHLLDGAPADVYAHAVGPTLLNHVLVGILLLPLGVTTWVASAADVRAQPWGLRLLLSNAFVLLTLPASIALCMRRAEYYASPLFVTGVGLVLAMSLLAVAAALLLWKGTAPGGA